MYTDVMNSRYINLQIKGFYLQYLVFLRTKYSKGNNFLEILYKKPSKYCKLIC